VDELRAAERRLQAAQLAGDTAAVEQLLDHRVLFTSGSTGACYAKHDDRDLHPTRQQILTTVIDEGLTVLVEGRTGVTWFLGTVEGTVAVRASRHDCATPAPGSTTAITDGVLSPPTPATSNRR
jgi:hypothetical protein